MKIVIIVQNVNLAIYLKVKEIVMKFAHFIIILILQINIIVQMIIIAQLNKIN